MAKLIEVHCNRHIATTLIEALRWFVTSNYPQAVDECSSAAREALLDLADRFEQELLVNGHSCYSSRVRAFLCEAIRGYCSRQECQTGQSYANRCELIIKVCRGLDDGAGLQAATGRDIAGAPERRSSS